MPICFHSMLMIDRPIAHRFGIFSHSVLKKHRFTVRDGSRIKNTTNEREGELISSGNQSIGTSRGKQGRKRRRAPTRWCFFDFQTVFNASLEGMFDQSMKRISTRHAQHLLRFSRVTFHARGWSLLWSVHCFQDPSTNQTLNSAWGIRFRPKFYIDDTAYSTIDWELRTLISFIAVQGETVLFHCSSFFTTAVSSNLKCSIHR